MTRNRSSEVANGYIYFPSTIGWKDIPSAFSCIDSFVNSFLFNMDLSIFELSIILHWSIWISVHFYYTIFDTVSQSVSSVTQLCLTLRDPINCSMPGLPVHHQLPESTQIHVHWVSDASQPSHPLLPPSPPALNLSQHQGFFHWVSSSHQVAKMLEFQLQHQSFQWTPRTDLL